MDVIARTLADRVVLVQTVQEDIYALWVDGKETGTTVSVERIMAHRRGGVDTLTVVLEAGSVELRGV